MKKELGLLIALYGAALGTRIAAQQTVQSGVPPTVQLPGTYLGPNGGIKVECIAGTCTGSGGAAATVAIDQTTPGTTDSVTVKNTGFNINNFLTTAAAPNSVRLTNGTVFYDARDRNWTITETVATTVGNFPTAANTSAISVRCVNTAGNAFESCAGAGGGTGGTVAIDQTTPGTTNGVQVNNFPATQPVSGTVAVSNFPASQPVTGTFWQATQPVSIASMPSTPVTGTFWQATQPVSGTVTNKFQAINGCYSLAIATGTYSGLAANTPLFSARWTSASAVAIVQRVAINVITTTAATVAAITERQLIFARSFTASDTGGTAVNLTGNNQKFRTSFSSIGFADIRAGAPISAGTRTLDALPLATIISWSALNTTGMTIGGGGGVASGTAGAASFGGTGPVPLLDVKNGDYPVILAQNEGLVVRIGLVQPTSSVEQTFINFQWCEATVY